MDKKVEFWYNFGECTLFTGETSSSCNSTVAIKGSINTEMDYSE